MTMAYIDGFVIACPEANKQAFIDHAKTADGVFMDLGATRILECWGDAVPEGKTTDYRMAVKAEAGEAVLFSWIEWPDKATRDAAMAKMTEMMNDPATADPRMDPEKNPMPFDGKRLIFGGFAEILDTGAAPGAGYIDGFVIPVPKANEAAYRKQAEGSAPIFRDLGATRVVECWGDDVPHGKVTDFYGAVKAEEDETIVFSWIEYPDKATRDEAGELMMSDPRFEALGEMPFDGKRMIYAGFAPVVHLTK
jgi:uncharacterized protein YbaA (DUF1428 family)